MDDKLTGSARSECGRGQAFRDRALARVVENDAERVAAAGANAADAVAQIDPVGALGALNRPVVDGEKDRVAAPQRHHVDPALHARPLFGQDEFAAGEIRFGLGQQHGDLQREGELAVEVLMQTIEVARPVLQQ